MSESGHVSVKEAARIAGVTTGAIDKWCRAGVVACLETSGMHYTSRQVSVRSLFNHIEERARSVDQSKVTVERPKPKTNEWAENIESCMNPVQLEAHLFLVNHADKIECPRAAYMTNTQCREYLRKYYGLERTAECKSTRCKRYRKPANLPIMETEPMLSPGPKSLDAHAQVRAFLAETPFLPANCPRGHAAKTKSIARMSESKRKLSEANKAKTAEQTARRRELDRNRDDYIAQCKTMQALGYTYDLLAEKFKVSVTTINRWLNGRKER